MDARFLLIVFDSVYVLALASWVGSVAFLSFVVAPVLFQVLGAEAGGKFVRALFPRYYAWNALAGAIALPAAMGVPLSYPELRGPMVGLQALALIAGTLINLYSGNVLTAAINAARDAGPEQHARFQRLHRRSVGLNALSLLLGVGLLIAFANRPLPQTAGIVEPTPQERARRAANRLDRDRGPRPDTNATTTVPKPR